MRNTLIIMCWNVQNRAHGGLVLSVTACSVTPLKGTLAGPSSWSVSLACPSAKGTQTCMETSQDHKLRLERVAPPVLR